MLEVIRGILSTALKSNEYLKFGNGSVIPGRARENGDILFVYLLDTDMKTAAELLSDPDNTATIIYHYYKVDLTFEGFTEVNAINKDGSRIIAMLEKDGAGNGEN